MRLLLNDTSEYHSGCKAVVQSYHFDHSIKTTESVDGINWNLYDEVILNGEGTLHHDAINARKFLNALKEAQAHGCKTIIENTVWQKMSNKWDSVLKNCESITVREIYSQKELQTKHWINSTVKSDRSLLVNVPHEEYDYVSIYEGQYWNSNKSQFNNQYPRIDIFKQSWNEIVNRLRNADVLISGRHHEIYAAIKAGCRFIALPGNTWKNDGIFASAGARKINRLADLPKVLSGDYDSEYEKILTFCS